MRVRAALAPLPDGGFDLLVKDTPDADWRPLLTVGADDVPSFDALSFSQDGRSLLLTSAAGSDTGRLVRIDIETGAMVEFLADPDTDVMGVLVHPDTREPQIVSLVKARAEFHVLDPSVEADFEAVRKLDAGDPQFVGRDDADRTWLVSFNNDDEPAKYYWYDRASRTGSFLFTSRPESPPVHAGQDRAVLVHHQGRADRARVRHVPGRRAAAEPAHGAECARWPANPGRMGLPARAAVDGQPRGTCAFRSTTRGSTGYGKAFVAAGDREWGAKMHDDLLDAVAYVIAQGWADQDRVAIMAPPTAATRRW